MVDDHPCFDEINDDEPELISMGLVPQNTKEGEKKCERCLMAYLKHKGNPQDYGNVEEPGLDKILGKFWFEAKNKKKKKKKGEKYTVASLCHLHYGLNHGLKRRGHAYNIITSDSFSESQTKFNDACLYLKSLGKGYVKHYKEIKPSARVKIILKCYIFGKSNTDLNTSIQNASTSFIYKVLFFFLNS